MLPGNMRGTFLVRPSRGQSVSQCSRYRPSCTIDAAESYIAVNAAIIIIIIIINEND